MKKILNILHKIGAALAELTGIRQDLIYHFVLCFALTFIGGYYGAAFAAGWGVGKEHGDSNSPTNKWDWWDIVADGLGILSGLVIRCLIVRYDG